MTDTDAEDRAGREPLSPQDAFSLLENETRAAILLELSRPRGDERNPPVVSFSELRSRVDLDVDSSQFNYHLQQLVGVFVEKRDSEDAPLERRSPRKGSAPVEEIVARAGTGYTLRPTGLLLAWIVRATTVAGRSEPEPFEAGFDCHFCGTAVEAAYTNSMFRIQCPDCSYLYDYNVTPLGVIGGDEDDDSVLERAAEYNRHVRLSFARGVCPLCAGGVDSRFVRPADLNYPRADRREVMIYRSCSHCGYIDYLTVGETLLRDPGLIAFCYDHGLDVTSTRLWNLEFATTDRGVTVRSTDPWEVGLRVTIDGDAFEAVLDEDLQVASRTRR